MNLTTYVATITLLMLALGWGVFAFAMSRVKRGSTLKASNQARTELETKVTRAEERVERIDRLLLAATMIAQSRRMVERGDALAALEIELATFRLPNPQVVSLLGTGDEPTREQVRNLAARIQ